MKPESIQWLEKYIEGEIENPSESVLADLTPYLKQSSQTVYRGLSYADKAEFMDRFPSFDEQAKTLIYSPKGSVTSFSKDVDAAKMFAQDLYGNFGVVLEMEISENYLDINELSLSVSLDFDHESEVLVLGSFSANAKILEVISGTKDRINLP